MICSERIRDANDMDMNMDINADRWHAFRCKEGGGAHSEARRGSGSHGDGIDTNVLCAELGYNACLKRIQRRLAHPINQWSSHIRRSRRSEFCGIAVKVTNVAVPAPSCDVRLMS